MRYHDGFYKLRRDNDTLELAGSEGTSEKFLSTQAMTQGQNMYYYGHKVPDTVKVFDSCQRVLIANSLGGNDHFPHYISRPSPPDDQAELFLFVNDSPDTFRLHGIGGGTEPSMVMYQRTLFKPPTP